MGRMSIAVSVVPAPWQLAAAVTLLAVAASLAGCGQKGPLELPPAAVDKASDNASGKAPARPEARR
jgi:predicted small lipoprotein YifL